MHFSYAFYSQLYLAFLQTNAAQYNSIQLNIAQCSSMKFNSPDESASLGEAARRAKRAPSMLRNLLGSAGMCWDLLASFWSCSILKRASRSLSGRFWYFAYFSHTYANYWPNRGSVWTSFWTSAWTPAGPQVGVKMESQISENQRTKCFVCLMRIVSWNNNGLFAAFAEARQQKL